MANEQKIRDMYVRRKGSADMTWYRKGQSFTEFAVHKKFEPIRTAYAASFSRDELKADKTQLTQLSAAGLGNKMRLKSRWPLLLLIWY